MTQPISVYIAPTGPNPWKVVVILKELDIPYKVESVRFENVKSKPYTDINPNGRVPAIYDPNTDITLWESGAIIQYLVKQYDTNKLLHYDTLKEQAHTDQWLHFQMSGQGPYYGQATWFRYIHPEKIQSAIDRYANEVKRVLGVLEGVLAAKPADQQWLVGNKMTYADLSFVSWNERLVDCLGPSAAPESGFDGFPHVKAWHKTMAARPSWQAAVEQRAQLMDDQGLDAFGMPKDNNGASLSDFVKGVNEGTA
ncbi:glutathione S-transferase [Bombardia bombarda]|uniref:glutathione transferase n=1 Tax=Bombardia bombarda TaxID=252184 RepID=A0AA39XD43_9PEZI|nr:glutathione S-transferase [Bombardia bombarda]